LTPSVQIALAGKQFSIGDIARPEARECGVAHLPRSVAERLLFEAFG
jgi:hypothetical protein